MNIVENKETKAETLSHQVHSSKSRIVRGVMRGDHLHYD